MALPRDRKVSRSGQDQTCFLTPDHLLIHEADSLQQMAIAPWPARLSWWKSTLLTASKRAKNEGVLNAYVWFEAQDPRAGGNDPSHFVELGAQIRLGTNPLVTYFFVVGQAQSSNKRLGLRKLHFDFDPSPSTVEPKPAMHMQLAGRTPPALATYYADEAFDHLSPHLDKPRVPCFPKSFALLAHLALLEYQSTDESLKNFVSDSKWISVVKASEQALLRPHFTFCQEWLKRTEKTSSSLLSYFYRTTPA